MQYPIFIIRLGDEICSIFDRSLGVCHGDSQPGVLNHGNIIVAVAAAYHLVRGQPDAVQKLLEGIRLVDMLGHDFQEKRL